MARRQRKADLIEQYPPLSNIVGESQRIVEVCEQIIRYAPTTLSALITGPSGSGKELVARALHACSVRKDRPSIAQNCAGIPDALLEDELFGYERGAFTDAKQRG